MRDARPAELVLGSVQLGVSYGVANRTGKPTRAAALRLVSKAVDAGVTKFDTARAYGESEERLGEALRTRKAVRTITKLSPLSELPLNASPREVRAAVDASVEQSLYALRREQIDCLLLHRASHMTAFDGAIWDRLVERLEDGTVLSLGVSVQSPQEALAALDCGDVQHLQLPFNLLDWRWAESGVIDRIRDRSTVTIHARSVFLQGLLAADDASIWPRIDGVNGSLLLRLVNEIAREFGRDNAADLCVAYARGQDWIDGVVVGMETEDQLDDNLRLFLRRPLAPENCVEVAARLPRAPAALLDPSQWPKRA